eukprot:CAMPEP_0118868598 /NCGR_PEP_ID=MMETSP1163-20130328/12065_1 /TAXON_ID=124430 /ORGANISM="Phaeomonas parva, Strain CCMP2877" /LENGTH=125 /DNA_ID=CAMNT_0006803315 /DNA_START=71 /DNA_END=449 /DNA_ORIENTATION=+
MYINVLRRTHVALRLEFAEDAGAALLELEAQDDGVHADADGEDEQPYRRRGLREEAVVVGPQRFLRHVGVHEVGDDLEAELHEENDDEVGEGDGGRSPAAGAGAEERRVARDSRGERDEDGEDLG